MNKQTLTQAMALARSGGVRDLVLAAFILDGLPVGGWPQTTQAWDRMEQILLPPRQDREYTADEFVRAAYVVTADDHYRTKDDINPRR